MALMFQDTWHTWIPTQVPTTIRTTSWSDTLPGLKPLQLSPAMATAFNPDLCAQLHNELLSRTYESLPGASQYFERDMIARITREESTRFLIRPSLRELGDDADEYDVEQDTGDEENAFYRFFSQIYTCNPPGTTNQGKGAPLSGEFLQPEPALFYHPYLEHTDDERHIILLYPDNTQDEPHDGGLFVDLHSWLATWDRLDHGPRLVRKSEWAWVPLEVALRKSLAMWDRGKYEWDEAHDVLAIRFWTDSDVDEAVAAWDRLLEAIASRRSSGGAVAEETVSYRDPLPSALVDGLGTEAAMSPFARSFLKRARRPLGFTRVAPGLTFFTDESFDALMGAESRNSSRRKYIEERGLQEDEWPSLLVPAAEDVPPGQDVPLPGPSKRDFGNPWGSGDFLVQNTAGLYTGLADVDGDSVLLITTEGTSSVDFAFQRPWGRARSLSLAEMFALWTGYIEQDMWETGTDGVVTSNAWFRDPATMRERKVVWSDQMR